MTALIKFGQAGSTAGQIVKVVGGNIAMALAWEAVKSLGETAVDGWRRGDTGVVLKEAAKASPDVVKRLKAFFDSGTIEADAKELDAEMEMLTSFIDDLSTHMGKSTEWTITFLEYITGYVEDGWDVEELNVARERFKKYRRRYS